MNHHSTAYGSIVGLVAAVPDRIITNADCPDPAAADEAAKLTGVRERRWVREGQTAYDLNLAAANRVLAGMGWAGSELDLIVYVTQTPTRAVPADVYSLAAAVGATCPCMQLNWSCSGYVYGLWTAMRMLSAGQRALLVVGDATSTIADPSDRATARCSGMREVRRRSSATRDEQHFVMGTDGSGAEKLCTDRHPPNTRWSRLSEDGRRSGVQLHAQARARDGRRRRSCGAPDTWLLHQANEFMLKHLAKKAAGRCADEHSAVRQYFVRVDPAADRGPEADVEIYNGGRVGMLGFGAGWAWLRGEHRRAPLQVCELIEV
jgi:3-oxoacyl-[acyl-carrier-protein] synthase-3